MKRIPPYEKTVIASLICEAISSNFIQNAIPVGRDKVPVKQGIGSTVNSMM